MKLDDLSSWMPESLSSWLATGLIVVFLWWLIRSCFSNRRRLHLPPGPRPLPLLGNIREVSRKLLHQVLINEYRQKYGDMITLYLGSAKMILISDYNTAMELLVNQYPIETSGRGHSYGMEYITEGYNDIVAADYGPRWKFQRKISYSALRKFAQGKSNEVFINEAFGKFKEQLDQQNSRTNSGAFNPYDLVYWMTYNGICAAVFGKVYDFDDEEFIHIRNAVEEMNRALLDHPWLTATRFAKYTLPLRKIRKHSDTLHAFIRRVIEEHEARQEEMEAPQDITDFLLQEQKQAIAEKGEKATHLQSVHVRQTVFDLFTAGTDTTAVSLVWLIGSLAKHPEVQERCFKEIQSYFGDNMGLEPQVEWRHKLHYTQATLYELLRFSTVANLGFPHRVMTDCKIGNYDLPQDAIIILNLYGFNHDPQLWENPESFLPERFLDGNGKFVLPSNGFLPFGCGRRVCIGELVAKNDLFLFLVLFCRGYKIVWSCDEQEKEERLELQEDGNNSFFRYPQQYKIQMLSRGEH